MQNAARAPKPAVFNDDEKSPPTDDPRLSAAAKQGWKEGTAEYEAQQKGKSVKEKA